MHVCACVCALRVCARVWCELVYMHVGVSVLSANYTMSIVVTCMSAKFIQYIFSNAPFIYIHKTYC